MSLATKERRADHGTERLVAVEVGSLSPASLDFDLYVKREDRGNPVLYCRRGHCLDPADLDRLAKRGISTLYISQCDHAAYRTQALEALAEQEDIPAVERFRITSRIAC